MKITVTQEDIDQGRPGSGISCAVARAARRLPGVLDVAVSEVWAILTYDDHVDDYRLPPVGTQFIRDFDARRTVAPIEIELTEPAYVFTTQMAELKAA